MKNTRTAAEGLTIDEIASMTDAEAVRRQFDWRNAQWLGLVATGLFFAAVVMLFVAIADKKMTEFHVLHALVHLVFGFFAAAFFGELAVAERKRGAWKPRLPVHVLRRNLIGWVTGYLVIEFALLATFHGSLAWSVIFPWVIVPVRMFLPRRIAIHATLWAIVAVNMGLFSSGRRDAGELVGAGVVSAMALTIGAITSVRMRKETVESWGERRTSAREQLRMRDELRYAREVQLSMLPESAPSLDWLDVAGTSVPATEVGGDYFDYFAEEDQIALVCGDVAGHGLASGIVLASLRSGFTLLRHSLKEPGAVLQQLNDLVAQTSRRRMLATAAVVLLDRNSRVATIASAGHPPVMIGRNGTVAVIELFAPPLGVRLPFNVTSTQVPFADGDVFVLHSDGVYEAQNAAGEVYGLDRLQRVIAAATGSAAAIRDAILRDVEEFRGAVAQGDDVTVVVARVVGG